MFNWVRHKKYAENSAPFETEAMPHMKTLFRVAMWLVRDRKRAEELVQETFTQALASFHRFEPGTNCCAWLVAIMYRLNHKRNRETTKLQLVSDTEERISETIAYDPPTLQDVTEEEILRALEHLPHQFQEVVVLSDIEGMTYKEIADVLLISVGTAMSRLSRGRKLLRAELSNYANTHGTRRAAVSGSNEQASTSSASEDR